MPIKICKMMILQKRHNAFPDKHRSVLQENKPFVQVCHHGLKRQRGHWSIELFQSKRCAIQLAAERSGRRELDLESNWVLAVKFSSEAVADALSQFEQETPQYNSPLVRGANTDRDGDKQLWQYNGPALPLLKADKDGILQVSAWTEKIDTWHSKTSSERGTTREDCLNCSAYLSADSSDQTIMYASQWAGRNILCDAT